MTIWVLWSDESGANMAEYALLVSLIAIPLITVIFPSIRDSISGIFTTAQNAMG